MAKELQKLSGQGKRLRHKWTYDQKLTLRLFFVEFELAADQATAIFNSLYAEHLKSDGFPTGLAVNTIKLQYYERTKSNAPKEWTTICADAVDSEEIRRRQQISRQISRTAVSLNMNIQHIRSSAACASSSPEAMAPVAPTKRAGDSSQVKSTVFQGDQGFAQRPNKKPKTKTRKAMVIIPKDERDVAVRGLSVIMPTPPKTPKRNRSVLGRRPEATIKYKLPSGTEIFLTPEQYRETQLDLVPLAESVAHPHVPLLFRFSTEECQSPLTERGFCAGRFATTIIPPPAPPSLDTFPWSDAATHLNRDQIASPFISTSNNLVWILRLALKESERGAKGGRITLIDPKSLQDRRAIFHAQPIHRELSKKRPFDKKAWMYHGMCEFLCWAFIPKAAIISSFPVERLFDLAARNPNVAAILRLKQLGANKTSYQKVILPSFKQHKITLSSTCIAAIAKVCLALGLHVTLVEAVSSTIADIIQGFGLELQYQTSTQWAEASAIFANAMSANSSTSVAFEDQQAMRYAFLDGCRWSRGDPNARQKPRHLHVMIVRAKKIGIDSPAEILTNELDAAKKSIMSYDKTQQALLRGNSSRALLADPDEIEDQILPSLPLRPKRISCMDDEDWEMVSHDEDDDDDDDDDDEEDQIMYEL